MQIRAFINLGNKFVNKTELIEALAKETDLSKAAADRALDALVAIITKTVAKIDRLWHFQAQ
jgi:nucleoid DNA-binding protein